MKVYVAGSYSGRHRIAKEAARLTELGFTVLSRWFDVSNHVEKAWDDDFSGVVAQTMAEVDMYAIINADLLVLDTIDKSSTGGSDTELGAALMRSLLDKNIRVIHIGPYRNVFHTLARDHYDSWDDFMDEAPHYFAN